MKKILSILICSAMILSVNFTVIVNAEGSSDIDEEQNLSQEELELLEELYTVEPNFSIEGEIVSITKEVELIETAEERIAAGVPMTRGAIGNNYMSIYIVTARVYNPGYDTFNISATATWKLVPAFRAQDAFAISWAGNFALISSTATASYRGMGVLNGKTSQIYMSPNAGVGYSVEASHYYGQALSSVTINAKISQADSTGVANIAASYCHTTVGLGGLGISYNNPGYNIGFTFNGAYDTASNYSAFYY